VKAKFTALFYLILSIKTFALNPSLPPSSNFDLSAWKVQTLDVDLHVVNILSPELTNGYTTNYFYTNPTDGSLVFKVPSNGDAITGATGYPRVELRQMSAGANWKLTDAIEHYLTAQCKVVSVAAAKPSLIIGQIHGSENESEMIKLRWSGYNPGLCTVEARFEMNDSLRTEYGAVLATGLSLGDIINYTITMKNGTVTVTVNGNSASQTYTPEFFGIDDAYYFKAGNYFSYNNMAVNDPTVYIGQTQFYKISLVKITSGISESLSNTNQISIYPNPVKTNLNINFNSDPASYIQFDIYDVNGKKLKTILNTDNQTSIYQHVSVDISHLKNGVYFVKCTTNNATETKRFIVEK
jgi:hypothetical protein